MTLNEENSPVRFLADAMLGRLGRWLRILGYDVTTFKHEAKQAKKSADKILEEARAEKRLILTRDTYFLKRKSLPPHLFIEDDRLEDQLRQVFKDLHLKPEATLNRCLDCNLPLGDISKEKVKDRVPSYVLQTQTEFSECPKCKKIYWEGTHVERMIEQIERIKHIKRKG